MVLGSVHMLTEGLVMAAPLLNGLARRLSMASPLLVDGAGEVGERQEHTGKKTQGREMVCIALPTDVPTRLCEVGNLLVEALHQIILDQGGARGVSRLALPRYVGDIVSHDPDIECTARHRGDIHDFLAQLVHSMVAWGGDWRATDPSP
jgi:hypothetical protein